MTFLESCPGKIFIKVEYQYETNSYIFLHVIYFRTPYLGNALIYCLKLSYAIRIFTRNLPSDHDIHCSYKKHVKKLFFLTRWESYKNINYSRTQLWNHFDIEKFLRSFLSDSPGVRYFECNDNARKQSLLYDVCIQEEDIVNTIPS